MYNLSDLYSWIFNKVQTLCLHGISRFIRYHRSQIVEEIIVQPEIESLKSTID